MLKLEDVHVYYGQVHALKGISMNVQQGELVALLGANGAGKSTTLMVVSGILRPSKGRAFYDNLDLTKVQSNSVVNSGIIQCPEGRHIFGGLTVKENLLMGAIPRKDRSQVMKDMDWVCSLFPILEKRSHQMGSTLSGGEQQMLAIARALMARPRLLLLDEPSLGLAPVIVQTIFDVIQQLHQQGVTILLVEQNARKALQVADRCFFLETGKVVMSGTVEEVRSNAEIERYYLGG